MYTTIFYIIIAIIIIEFIWDFILGELNRKSWASVVPDELSDVYPQEKFIKQKQYRLANYNFNNLSSFISLIIIVAFLFFEGFAHLNRVTGEITNEHWLLHSLLFFASIGFLSLLLSLPFSVYQTFVIEDRFGFNKTTPKIFVGDIFKSIMISSLLGGALLSLIIWFYESAGSNFWLYAWIGMSLFMIFFSKFYTTFILPLFNKLKPLDDGELRSSIEELSNKTGFPLDNVYVMDGSKRSTKANAFFSGFGKNKKIVLFDTLINDLSNEEIVAVLAHEIGHFKLKHILAGTITAVVQMGVTLFLLGWFVNHPAISSALGVDKPVFHIGLTGFALLYSPVSAVTGLAMTLLSRYNEYKADRFAAKYYNKENLVSALKKISAKSLVNPTPNKWYVFFNYSHPPLIDRIKAIRHN
ncbi:M48 family metallopeptidase [Marinilabiliaceae bacterium ANBcel2]|nr:M48 family metallopeptidase [Marinilabiliaceae bacterium ANBcel2]